MRMMGIERAMVVNARDGMDEISTASDTVVSEIKDGRVINYILKPEDFGFERTILECLQGGDAATNAAITMDILKGSTGHRRDIVLLNAGATIYISGRADSIEEGIEIARDSIDSGKALQKLQNLIAFTNRPKEEL